jgi:L-asparaginase II
MEELLVEEYRGGILECVHRGHICGVSDSGEVKYSVGDDEFVAFLRSSAKPIQAIPLIKHGLKEKYNLTDKEATIIAGSHRAEPFHVEALESMMKKIGIKDEDFVCLPTYPLRAEARENLIRSNKPKRSIYHNCSGKHISIMTLCKFLGCSIEDYWDINNPAQQEILEHISMVADYPKEDIKIGVDGCGVPVFAMPLKYLAKAFMRMVCPDLIEDKEVREAVIKITRLMNENYEMVSGTNLICSLLLMDPNIVAKGGSKGVYCFGLREERLGFAIKVMDGAEEQWPFIVASILEQINYKNKDTIKRLYDVFPLEVKNDNNKIVGVSKVKFQLNTV